VLELVGRLCRWLPPVRGKYRLAQRLLAPLIRGKGYRTIVPLRSAGGGRLICCLDDWIPWTVFVFGRYISETEDERFMVSCAAGGPQGQTIFDIGANIGYYTVQLARTAGPGARLHAFEPVSSTAALLAENVALNGLRNVVVNRAIVSDTLGAQPIYLSATANTGQSSLVRASARSETVDTVTVDAYCQARNIERIDLVKVDVEGHELRVLQGMAGLLRSGCVGCICAEANEELLRANGASTAAMVDFMQRLGYRGRRLGAAPADRRATSRPAADGLLVFERGPGQP